MGTYTNPGIVDLERGPRIVCIPSADHEMCDVVRRVYTSSPQVTPGRLQAALRAIYPTAVVRRRELSGEPVPTWYVFRERA